MKKKIIVCFFGVISRSIRFTNNNFQRNLIDVIKNNNYEVDIYVFNNNVENCIVDEYCVNNNDYKLLNPTFFEEITQKQIDAIIDTEITTKNINCDSGYYRMRKPNSANKVIRNCVRQLYSEEQVGIFIEKNKDKYDAAVVCSADLFLIKPVNIKDIEDSMKSNSKIYTTNCNDGQGYTNGFYFGLLEPMIKILKRFSILDKLYPNNKDYEYMLKQSFLQNNLTRCITKMEFLKIRNNKKFHAGMNIKRKYKRKKYQLRFEKILGHLNEELSKCK